MRQNIVNRYCLLDVMVRKRYNPYSSMALERKSMVYQDEPEPLAAIGAYRDAVMRRCYSRGKKVQKNMRFCETNPNLYGWNLPCSSLITRWLQLPGQAFQFGFVFPIRRSLYEVDFGL